MSAKRLQRNKIRYYPDGRIVEAEQRMKSALRGGSALVQGVLARRWRHVVAIVAGVTPSIVRRLTNT
jgi:hypothetical protein